MTTVEIRRFVARARRACSLLCAALTILTAVSIRPAHSAGFLNNIQSVGAAAVSTAGQTAIAEDASTIYYNAAGMSLLDRPELVFAAPVIFLSNRFKDTGTTAPLGGPAQGSGGNNDGIFTLPSVFASLPLSDRLTAGLGLFIPFGQVNDYDDNWVGRYQLQSISLKTFDIDTAFSYRISDAFSIGAGLDVQYAHLKRRNAIDFGSLCFVVSSAAACPGLGLLPQGADGQVNIDTDHWGVGFNVGLLYHLGDATHIGLSYRSAIRHSFSGNADFTVPAAAAPLTAGGLLFQDTSVASVVTFPDILALGLSQRLDDRLTLLVDADWTGWSRLTQARLNFGNPAQPTQTLVFNWQDSYRFAVGGIYRFSDDTDLRAGVSYGQSAVSDTFRSADLPDSDAVMLSAGLMHRFNDEISATVSYSYVHRAAASVDLTQALAGTLMGTYQRNSNAVGFQVRVQL